MTAARSITALHLNRLVTMGASLKSKSAAAVDPGSGAAAAARPALYDATPHANDPPILFLLPGSVGYGPSLAALAATMSHVARVVPVRYPGLRQILEGQNTLSAMAAAALDQIERWQPSGNVRLLGHSLGGAVAFEVAARLLAAGRSVRFLGILDTSMTGERGARWTKLVRTYQRMRTRRAAARRTVCRALAKVAAACGEEARLAAALDRRTNGQFNPTCFRIRQELQEVLRERAFFQWIAAPKPVLPICGTIFRCKRAGASDALGWERAFAAVDVVPIAGGHVDLIVPPHITTNRPLIERAVAQTYERAEAGTPADRSLARAGAGGAFPTRA